MLIRLLISLLLVIPISYAQALRIVSLSPYLTESIMMLGGADSLVGITTVSKRLFNLDRELIGDTININIEKIASLNPDIVLATPMNNIERVERIKSLGFKVKYFKLEKNFEDCCINFMELAELIGKTEKAESMIAQSEKRLEALSRRLKSKETKNIFIEIGYSPLITVGRDCYFDNLAEYAKTYNVAREIKSGFFRVIREEILRLDPEYILVISEDYPASFKKWRGYKFLTAVKNNNLIRLDGDNFSRPNPINFTEAAYMLAAKVYPELFNED